MRFHVVWNPLHPAVGLRESFQTLLLYYPLLTVIVAVAGVDVTAPPYIAAACIGGVSVGVVKAWQHRYSPVAPVGNPLD